MRWRILALLFVARVGLGFQFQTLASVGDNLVVAFGLDWAGIGVLIGLFMAPGLIISLPAGYWGREVSDRNMIALGLAALALGGLVCAFASAAWMVGLGRIIAGTGFVFANLYATKAVADWFEGREIATAMSVLVMSWPFGIAMGQVGHAWLAEVAGWPVPFQVASAYCIAAAFAIWAFYRAPGNTPAQAPSKDEKLTTREWQLVFCAATAWGTFNSAYVIYLSFGPKVLEGLGLSALSAAGVISVASWLMIFSGAICGQISDRVGRRLTILLICMSGAVLSLALLNVPGAGLWASLIFGLIGVAPAGVIMAMAGQAMRPQVRAFGMGVFFTIYFAFMLASPPLAGALLDATGRAAAPLMLAMLLFASVVPLAVAFQRLKSGPQPAAVP